MESMLEKVEGVDNCIRLNLGAGETPISGFIPIDRKSGKEVYPLTDYADGSVDEIRASHILEHFSQRKVADVMKEWARVLKFGGVISIAVPNFDYVHAEYAKMREGKEFDSKIFSYLMGGHDDENDYHKSTFNPETLEHYMAGAGFTQIEKWESTAGDCASLPVSLNLRGVKAKPIPKIPKVSALMSVPRLMFTENVFSCLELCQHRRIPFEKVTGVFWGQCMERGLEKYLADGTEWILTIDYDSLYSVEQFDELCRLMLEHPEADAIAPIQMKRDEGAMLMTPLQDNGEAYPVGTPITLEMFEKPLTRASWSHFGLTLIRTKALAKMKHPWFLSIPAKDGKWGEGRVDEDIFFWRKWFETGNTMYVANHVAIGHAQNTGTWPDQQLQPFHQYVNAWLVGGKKDARIRT